jgi:hypothetical protein
VKTNLCIGTTLRGRSTSEYNLKDDKSIKFGKNLFKKMKMLPLVANLFLLFN